MQTTRSLPHRSHAALVAGASLFALAGGGCLQGSVTLGSDTGGGSACIAQASSEAITLAPVTDEPSAIATNGTNVFWATSTNDPDTGSIWKVPVGGGEATLLVTATTQQQAVAADATDIYWCDNGLYKMSQDGGTPTLLVAGVTCGSALTLDATNVYYANYYWSGNSVRKVPKEGGAPVVIAQPFTGPSAIAVDATNIYVKDEPGTQEPETLLKVAPLAGGPSVGLAPGWPWAISGGNPNSVAIGAGEVFWTNGAHIGALSLAGVGNGSVLYDAGGGVGIAVDATSVYVLGHGNEIVKLPLDGCPAVTLATTVAPAPWLIAVDATSVYWFDSFGTDSQSLKKVAK